MKSYAWRCLDWSGAALLPKRATGTRRTFSHHRPRSRDEIHSRLHQGALPVAAALFTDYLVAMKLADGWQIVSKSYRYDLRE